MTPYEHAVRGLEQRIQAGDYVEESEIRDLSRVRFDFESQRVIERLLAARARVVALEPPGDRALRYLRAGGVIHLYRDAGTIHALCTPPPEIGDVNPRASQFTFSPTDDEQIALLSARPPESLQIRDERLSDAALGMLSALASRGQATVPADPSVMELHVLRMIEGRVLDVTVPGARATFTFVRVTDLGNATLGYHTA